MADTVISLVLAFMFEHINYIGVVVILGGLAIAKWQQNVPEKYKTFLQSIVILWSLALAAHLLPGFNNLHVINQVTTGPQSLAFTMYLNLDKPLIFFALLLLMPTMLNQQVKPKDLFGINVFSGYKPFVIILSMVFVIFITAMALLLIKPELSFPQWWWIFALNNLLFVCVAEEAFFRGFIQGNLAKKYSPESAILISSILFGLAHFAGGIGYMFVATIAGLLYGFTYIYTGKLSAAIGIHFTINILHLCLFTYPMAK